VIGALSLTAPQLRGVALLMRWITCKFAELKPKSAFGDVCSSTSWSRVHRINTARRLCRLLSLMRSIDLTEIKASLPTQQWTHPPRGLHKARMLSRASPHTFAALSHTPLKGLPFIEMARFVTAPLCRRPLPDLAVGRHDRAAGGRCGPSTGEAGTDNSRWRSVHGP